MEEITLLDRFPEFIKFMAENFPLIKVYSLEEETSWVINEAGAQEVASCTKYYQFSSRFLYFDIRVPICTSGDINYVELKLRLNRSIRKSLRKVI